MSTRHHRTYISGDEWDRMTRARDERQARAAAAAEAAAAWTPRFEPGTEIVASRASIRIGMPNPGRYAVRDWTRIQKVDGVALRCRVIGPARGYPGYAVQILDAVDLADDEYVIDAYVPPSAARPAACDRAVTGVPPALNTMVAGVLP